MSSTQYKMLAIHWVVLIFAATGLQGPEAEGEAPVPGKTLRPSPGAFDGRNITV